MPTVIIMFANYIGHGNYTVHKLEENQAGLMECFVRIGKRRYIIYK